MKKEKNSNLDKLFDTKSGRTFLFMKTLDLYIFREYLVIYSCCMLAFCTLFLISDLINNLGDFLGKASVWDGVHFFLLKQPGDIKFILPISLLLACLYTMARMGITNEITAMRASGISLLRCGTSMYLIGLIVTGVNFWFNESFVPNCNLKSEILINSIGDPDYIKELTRMLMYRSPDGSRTWLIKEFENMREQKDIQIKRYGSNGDLEMELYANKATWSPQEGWKFYKVSVVNYKKISLLKAYSLKNTGATTQQFVVPISSSFPVITESSEPFKELGHVDETPDDIFNMVKSPDQITTADILRRIQMSQGLSPLILYPLYTELYSRYAFPWVCLFAVMIGLPIAGKNARRGIVVSIMSAVAVVVAYSVFSQIFVVLGNKGTIPPILAGTLPTIGLAIYAFWVVNKYK